MITKAMVDEYIRFKGDIDGYARTIHGGGRVIDVSDSAWGEIDSALQDLRLIRRGSASPGYEQQAQHRMARFDADARLAIARYA